VGTGSREENASRQASRASVVIKSEPKLHLNIAKPAPMSAGFVALGRSNDGRLFPLRNFSARIYG
jgi:hypothetical protein